MFGAGSRLLLTCACVMLGLATAATQQTAQQPTFKTGAQTVAIYTTVTDGEGRLVPDLAREDFEIYDNGKLQPISVFASENQPVTVVMMLDRSGSVRANFALVEQAAEAFVRRLSSEDRARVGSFSTTVKLDPEEFTSDYEKLIGIIRSELQPAGPTPLWNAVNVAMSALRGQEGRRVVLVFTDGVDDPRNFNGDRVSHKDVMRRAQAEDVMVYGIGLESLVPYGGRRAPLPGRGSIGLEPRMISQKPDEGLAKLAAESGGGYFELAKAEDLRATFRQVAEELHRQYALGFEPAKLDGKLHKLEIKVKKPGMTARARKSYVAEKVNP
jgi:Ca-activated chloride channel family protein